MWCSVKLSLLKSFRFPCNCFTVIPDMTSDQLCVGFLITSICDNIWNLKLFSHSTRLWHIKSFFISIHSKWCCCKFLFLLHTENRYNRPEFIHKYDDEFICNAINAYMKRAYFEIANQIMSLMCGKRPFCSLVFIKYGGTEWFTMKTNDSFPIHGILQRFFFL